MYAFVIPRTTPATTLISTFEQVERPPLSVRLAQLGSRVRGMNLWVIDALLASAFVVLVLVGHLAATGTAGVDYRDADALSVLLSLGVSVPYYFRRHAPLAVLLVSEACVVVLTVREYQTGAAPSVLLIGIFTVAAWSSVRDRVIGVGGHDHRAHDRRDRRDPGFGWRRCRVQLRDLHGGVSVRLDHAQPTSVQRATRGTAAALENERAEEAKRAVAEERLRIAQDLHDVVAHSMGVIAVQAGVGAHVIDTDPVEAKKSLEAISQTSRSTLAEIRRMLGVLREDENASYEPAPGLADLDRLVRDVEGAGLDVDVRNEGPHTQLPPGVDFTAYRIVQEALTNVLKHAGHAHASVVVGYEENALRLEIADDGRGVNGRAAPGGHGLMGMRERVGVYGGSFEAGPRTGGGFRVAVRIPYGEDS